MLLVSARLNALGDSIRRRSARRGDLPVLPTALWIEVLGMLLRMTQLMPFSITGIV